MSLSLCQASPETERKPEEKKFVKISVYLFWLIPHLIRPGSMWLIHYLLKEILLPLGFYTFQRIFRELSFIS